jgi:hypothetical protein
MHDYAFASREIMGTLVPPTALCHQIQTYVVYVNYDEKFSKLR